MVSEANVYGGPNAVLTTNFGRAGKPMFANPPGCLFLDQATFITNFFLEDYPNLKPVEDFDFLPPPSYNSQFDGNIEFFFDNFVMYNDTPQSRALMNYLWTADAQQILRRQRRDARRQHQGHEVPGSRLPARVRSRQGRNEAARRRLRQHAGRDADGLLQGHPRLRQGSIEARRHPQGPRFGPVQRLRQ